MGFFTAFARRADLVARMARTVGADPARVVVMSDSDAQAYRGAVTRCAGCNRESDCTAFMDDADNSGRHPTAPDYCRNKSLMDGLANI